MEKMEDDDVIISCSVTLTLAWAVDILSNEKAKKSRNRKTLMKDWLRERDTTGVYAKKFQEMFPYEYRHLLGTFNYFCTLKSWTLNSKKKY